MKKNSVKLNYIFNLLYQVFSMITPLITTPYLSRVLTPEGVGKYGFAASLNSYFCMAASLGFSIHAQREVAKHQNNKEMQSVVFWEIIICRFISGFLAIVAYYLFIVIGFFGAYTFLMQIMVIELSSIVLDVTFFFQGNERFGTIALRDFLIRVAALVLIFVFVHKKEDLWIYAFCRVLSSLISVLSLWPCLKNCIVKISGHKLNPLKHIKPSIKLFIPTIAISIFTILDKTLIGVLIPGTLESTMPDGSVIVERIADIENGFYVQSEKIIKLAMMVLASLGTVMMPRNSKVLAEGNNAQFIKNINRAIEFVVLIGAPISTGIIAISFNFAPWFFGDGYVKVPLLLIIFSLMVLPSGLGNVFGQQYLIPKGEDGKYTIVYVVSAVFNLFLNLILIPRYLSYGAAVASVIAEMVAPIMMLFFIRKELKFVSIIKNNWKPVVSGLIMLICVGLTSRLLKPTFLSTVVLVFEGAVVYVTFAFLFKTPIAYEAYELLKNKFLKKTQNEK